MVYYVVMNIYPYSIRKTKSNFQILYVCEITLIFFLQIKVEGYIKCDFKHSLHVNIGHLPNLLF